MSWRLQRPTVIGEHAAGSAHVCCIPIPPSHYSVSLSELKVTCINSNSYHPILQCIRCQCTGRNAMSISTKRVDLTAALQRHAAQAFSGHQLVKHRRGVAEKMSEDLYAFVDGHRVTSCLENVASMPLPRHVPKQRSTFNVYDGTSYHSHAPTRHRVGLGRCQRVEGLFGRDNIIATF